MLFPQFNKRTSVPFLLLLLAFTGMLFLFGVDIAPDTAVYIESSPSVGPVYPMVIDAFQAVLPEGQFTWFVALFQCVFTAYAIFSLLEYLERTFCFGPLWEAVLAFGFILLYLLQTIVTKQGRISSNAILSEGIAFPLYYLVFKYLFAALILRRMRYLVCAAGFSFLLTNTRGQLLWLVPLLVCAAVYLERRTTKEPARRGRFYLRLAAALALYLSASALLTRSYNLLKSGAFSGNQLGRPVILTAALYVSTPEDADAFEEGSLERAIFEDCSAVMEKGRLSSRYSQKGVVPEFLHYEANCDTIQGYLRERVGYYKGSAEDPAAVDRAMERMTIKIVMHNVLQYATHYAINAFGGLIRSVSLFQPALIAWALLLYGAAAAALCWARKDGRRRALAVYWELCLICIAFNMLFVSFGVWCLSRYMFYNFPLFYTGIFLTGWEYGQFRREAKPKRMKVENENA